MNDVMLTCMYLALEVDFRGISGRSRCDVDSWHVPPFHGLPDCGHESHDFGVVLCQRGVPVDNVSVLVLCAVR